MYPPSDLNQMTIGPAEISEKKTVKVIWNTYKEVSIHTSCKGVPCSGIIYEKSEIAIAHTTLE